jgi:hypothetical protein
MEVRQSERVEEEKSKVVKLHHDKCCNFEYDFIILPTGFRYNVDVQHLREGDIIKFVDGSKHLVHSIARISIKSAIADSLCRVRYGISILRAYEIWCQRLRVIKEDVKSISENECLVVFFRKKEI